MAKKIQRIEKEIVLKELVSSDSVVHVHYRDKRLKAALIEYDSKTITLDLLERKSIVIKKNDQLSLFFRFRETPIACSVTFIEKVLGKHVFTIPVIMYRDLTRKYERLQLGNKISISIIVDGKKLNINFPSSASYFNPEAQNLKTPPPAISDLLRVFRERCIFFSSENNITLFRERKPSTIIERIIASSGKIVTLPLINIQNCPSMDSKIAVINAQNINLIATEAGEDPNFLRQQIKSYVLKMKTKKVYHELYVPILFYEYVVGYIYLMRSLNYTTAFECQHLELAYQFSCLFAHSLNSNGYFKATEGKSKIGGSELIDISATGLLFSYPSTAPSVELYKEIDFELETNGQVLPVKGQVMRKINEADNTYLGVQFTSITDESKDSLMKILYGSDYQKDIEII